MPSFVSARNQPEYGLDSNELYPFILWCSLKTQSSIKEFCKQKSKHSENETDRDDKGISVEETVRS